MINALYSAAGGMLANLEKQDVISQNIANVNTTGYRRQAVACQTFSDVLASTAQTASLSAQNPRKSVAPVLPKPFVEQDTRQGVWNSTGNPLNFAIEGEGFFVVQTSEGLMLTRNGSFTINSAGELSDIDGHAVIGEKGPIRMPDGEWTVDPDGTIKSGDVAVDKIKISLPATVKSSEAGGMTFTAATLAPAQAQLRQGSIEMSNVNVINEMVAMMTNLRGYEAGQRVIQSIDQSLDRLISVVTK